jgi:hypothetical protein
MPRSKEFLLEQRARAKRLERMGGGLSTRTAAPAPGSTDDEEPTTD